MRMMLKHVEAMPAEELVQIRRQAAAFRTSIPYDTDADAYASPSAAPETRAGD
jgi:hypothetical protein